MTRAWDPDGKPRKPRVLCIGAQKAGTSWLHSQLNLHPRIWTAPFKELHYFNARHRSEDRKWLPWHFRQGIRETERRFAARNEELPDDMVRYLLEITSEPMFTQGWYRRAFAPAPKGMLPLDTTPEYSTLPEKGVDEVAAFLPRTKFIYLIRDPADRAVSQLRMNLERKKVRPKTPREFLQYLDDPILADRGDYATYIPRWQARFGSDRLLILPYGRIAIDPKGLMHDVEAFLGLSKHDYPDLSKRVHVAADSVDFPIEGRKILRDRFARQYEFLQGQFGDEFMDLLSAPESKKRFSWPVSLRPRKGTFRKVDMPANEDISRWVKPKAERPRKPSVIGIGAQKSGTSWLHAALQQHPGLWASPLKEAHYFDHLHCSGHSKWTSQHVSRSIEGIRDRYQRMGLALPQRLSDYFDRIGAGPLFTDGWYQGLYAPAPDNMRPVDVTPAYSGLPPEGVDHFARYLPDAQMIYIIRDPVERALSQLRMNVSRMGSKPDNPAILLHAVKDPVIDARGDYASYIPRWQAHFGPDQLLILPYGQIARDPEGMMAQIEKFLGLAPHRYHGLEKRVFRTRSFDRIPKSVHESLKKRFAGQYEFLRDNFSAEFNAALS